MVVPFFHCDNHIIDIYLKVPPDFVGKHNVHDSVVGGVSVFEAERHDIVIVVSLV